MNRPSHQTLGAMKNAVVGEAYAGFATGSRVQTVDGYPGRVTAVLDGPFPQTETYEVALDNGLGGGEYTARQLRPLTERIAAVEEPMAVEASEIHLASEDYPELGSILYDRPPNERVKVYAGLRTTASFDWDELECTACSGSGEQGKYYCPACEGTGKRADQDPSIAPQYPTEPPCTACSGTGEQGTGHECYQCDGSGSAVEQNPSIDNANPGNGLLVGRDDAQGIRPVTAVVDVEQIPPPSACSWCGHNQFVNPTNTGRGLRMACAQCGGTMTSWGGQWQPDMTSSPENHPSRDGDFRSVINDPAAVHASLNQPSEDPRGPIMYHSTSPANRGSIAQHGLLTGFSQDPEGVERGIYMTPTEPDHHEDVWAIDTSRLDHLERDDPAQSHEFGGSYWTKHDVPLSAMRLHHRAAYASLTADSWDHWLAPETIASGRNFGEQVMARYDLLDIGDPAAAAVAVDPRSDPVDYLRGITAQANDDPDLGFHLIATWAEVREKAKRIKDSGGVRILAASAQGVVGEVQGDHALYESSFNYVPGTRKLADWNCFLPDAPVMMADGSEKPISQVKPGDMVITHTGHIQRVVRTKPKPFEGEIVRVQPEGDFRELVATSEHEVLVGNRDSYLVGRGRDVLYRHTGSTIPELVPFRGWRKIGQLVAGDYLTRPVVRDEHPLVVSVPRPPLRPVASASGVRGVRLFTNRRTSQSYWIFKFCEGGRTGTPTTQYFKSRDEAVAASDDYYAQRAYLDVKVDGELAYWLGWYTAEGFLVKTPYQVGFSLSADERWVAEQLDDIAWRKFGVRGSIRNIDNKIDYRISSFVLYYLAGHLVGSGAKTKSLSASILTLPEDEHQRFLDGWLLGDGCVDKNGQHLISTANLVLVYQAREMLTRMGFSVGVYRTLDNSGGLSTTRNAGPIYTARWMTKGDRISQYRAEGLVWQRIRSISRESYVGDVWDIEVEEDHSFRAYGYNVHNCGCKWGAYAWGRAPAYRRFEGRKCSHVTALQFEAQSRGMFGQDVTEDRRRLPGQYQRSPVTVQYERPTERADGGNINRRSVPPGNMRRTFSSSIHPESEYAQQGHDETSAFETAINRVQQRHVAEGNRLWHEQRQDSDHHDNAYSLGVAPENALQNFQDANGGREPSPEEHVEYMRGAYGDGQHPYWNEVEDEVRRMKSAPHQSSLHTARYNGHGLYFFNSGDTHPMDQAHDGTFAAGKVHAYDPSGQQVGEVGYALHAHEGGGRIQVDDPVMQGGQERHEPALIDALEHHLRTQHNIDPGQGWLYDETPRFGRHFAALDLAPVHAFAREMVQAGDTPDALFVMLANHGVAQENALRIIRWAVTGDDDGGSTQLGEDIPGITTRDTTEFKKRPHHHDHHTNDTRRHAPDFGRGIGWYAPGLMWCDQCNGSGCGHCGGTGQVMQDVSPTGGPGMGDLSTTTSPIADNNPNAGETTIGGISSVGALEPDAPVQDGVWYHGSRHTLQPGQILTGGHAKSNQGYGQPGEHVYYTGRHDVASAFAEAGNGPDHRPDAQPKVYLVEPVEGHEPDPDEPEEMHSYRARSVRVLNRVRYDHDGPRKIFGSRQIAPVTATLQQHEWLLQRYADASTTLMGGNPAPANNPLTPHSDSRNPGSTGWGTSADPHGWVHPIINNSYEIAAEASRHQAAEHGAPDLCGNCGEHIRATYDSVNPWVHANTQNAFCDVHDTRDATLLAGSPLERPEAQPMWHEAGARGEDYVDLSFTNHNSRITAHHPKHGEVGKLDYNADWPGDGVGIEQLQVPPKHRRRGVATQLMEELERTFPGRVLDHGPRTEDGHNWAQFYYGPHEVEMDREDPERYQSLPTLDGKIVHEAARLSKAHNGAKGQENLPEYTHAGVAVKAADTGRVLMIQRSFKDDTDPAKGTWEFPGGGRENGDQTSLHTGIREWQEEVGQPFPEGGHVSHTWRAGTYHGHVVTIPSESQVDFSQGRSTVNPDDPDGDDHEQAAWWDPQHAKKNPALRAELKKDNPFGAIEKAAEWNYTPQDMDSAPDDGPIIHPAGIKPPRRLRPGDTILWGDGSTHVINAATYKLLHVSRPDGRFPRSMHRGPIEGDSSETIEGKEGAFFTLDEMREIGRAEERRTGKSAEQLLREHIAWQEQQFAGPLHNGSVTSVDPLRGNVDDATYKAAAGVPITTEKMARSGDYSLALENRRVLHDDAAQRGHVMEWRRQSVDDKPTNSFHGECKHCGATMSVGTTWSSSDHPRRDARESQCTGPGTKWQSDMERELSGQRFQQAVSDYGQAVKDNYDRQWLHGQGIEAALHDQLEPALPSTDGTVEDGPQSEIGAMGWAPGDPAPGQYLSAQPDIPWGYPGGPSEPPPLQLSSALNDAVLDEHQLVMAFQATAVGRQLAADAATTPPADAGVAGGRQRADAPASPEIQAENAQLAAIAQAVLAGELEVGENGISRTAMKNFDLTEQQELITEGANDGTVARNFDGLQIEGTHYALLDDPEMAGWV